MLVGMFGRRRSSVGDTPRLPLFGLALMLPLVFAMAAECTSESVPPGPPTTVPGTAGRGVLEFNGDDESASLDNAQSLGINVLVNWSDLEPQEGVYDWSDLDKALAAAQAHGKRVAARVYTSAGDFGRATPGWVFAAGARSYVPDEGAEDAQPVPTDPVFTEKFGAFLRALGQRYDGHPALEFFQTNAGMGTYGEMVWGVPDSHRPPGWSPDVQVETSEYWIDRWREAFPRTPLVLMENYVGFGIVDKVAKHAVERGFYLQANDPHHGRESQKILSKYAGRTKIVMEIEDAGCRTALGDAFDATVDEVFAPGFAIDYLTVCGETIEREPGRVAAAVARLRR
jgi:hypothetical protein